MDVKFQDPEKSFVATLRITIASIQGEHLTLRELLGRIGEQGLLLFCMILTLPFLFPVSIPGVSTVFGAVIILIGVGVMMNRLPWLPERLMTRQIATARLIPVLERGANFLGRLERFVRPRLIFFTGTAAMSRFNGLMLVASGVLLMMPLGLVPFSNTLPALAILFLAVGMLQRDGVFILLGYTWGVLTVAYFAALFVAAVMAGKGIMSIWGGG